jgi:hypothetical protein
VRKRERVRKKMCMKTGKKGPAGSSSRGEPDAKHLTLRHRSNKLSGSYEIEEKKKGENNDKVPYSFNFVKYVNMKNSDRENRGRGGGRKSKQPTF